MRRIALLLTVLMAAACSDSTGPAAKANVTFKIDGQTCTGSGQINFFIDGSLVGSEILAAGGSSKPYATTQSSHTVGATVVSNGFTWPPKTVDLAGIANYTALLTC